MFAIAKNIPERTLLYCAGIAAIVSGLTVWFFLHHLEATYQESADTVTVLTANRYIPRGAVLRPSLFKPLQIPKAYVAADAVLRFDVLESSGRPLSRAAGSIPEGAPLSQRDLVPLIQADALSQQIDDTLVAVSFGVDRERGCGGNLQPGDLIDVLHTPKAKDFDVTPRPTASLLQALRVIAVGRQNEDDLIIVTVVANPLAAVRLAHARENETLSLILRAPHDDTRIEPL